MLPPPSPSSSLPLPLFSPSLFFLHFFIFFPLPSLSFLTNNRDIFNKAPQGPRRLPLCMCVHSIPPPDPPLNLPHPSIPSSASPHTCAHTHTCARTSMCMTPLLSSGITFTPAPPLVLGRGCCAPPKSGPCTAAKHQGFGSPPNVGCSSSRFTSPQALIRLMLFFSPCECLLLLLFLLEA